MLSALIVGHLLNRIEFQLQGEDLLDLYLIYDSAIFALEPATVRVREVGIQRNERRQAQRERDRQARESALLDAAGALFDQVTSSRPPSADITNAESLDSTAQAEAANFPQPPPALPGTDTLRLPQIGESTILPTTSTGISSEPSPNDSVARGSIPYTTFQQLEYLPPVPASILSASYIIPPTYESVLSASPMPGSHGLLNTLSPHPSAASSVPSSTALANAAPEVRGSDGTPRLNPVSLLANPTAKNPGPPGFFFVSKGKNLTSIVVSKA